MCAGVSARGAGAHAPLADPWETWRMWSGAELRARLAALPVVLLVLPWRCSLQVHPQDDREPGPSAVTAKQESPTPGRVSTAPPLRPPARTITLPEEVVVKAMAAGQQTFLRCWARAQRADPALGAAPGAVKVRLHLEIDERGKVSAVQSDTDSEALARCLAVVARTLPFPAPGKPAVVDLPLMFR
jgi:hypothetical protein